MLQYASCLHYNIFIFVISKVVQRVNGFHLKTYFNRNDESPVTSLNVQTDEVIPYRGYFRS